MTSYPCQVLNFTDGQVIDYRIVILRGIYTLSSPVRLVNFTAQEVGEPESTSLENENVVIFNCVEDQSEVGNGRHLFVALAQLVVGENVLSLCDTEHQEHFLIRLIYQPKLSAYQVRGLLIQTSDSKEDTSLIRSHIRRINFALELVQSIFADKLHEFGFSDETSIECPEPPDHSSKRRTFALATDYREESIIRIPQTTVELTNMNDIWKIVGETIRKNDKLWAENVKYVAIMNIEDCSTVQHLLLAGMDVGGLAIGGLAIFSSKLNRWPTNLKELLKVTYEGVNDKEFMKLVWLGGITHEVGHLFDLGHASRGLMSNDYYKTKLIFCPRTMAKKKHFRDFYQNQPIIENAQNNYFIPKIFSKSATNQISLSEDSNALNLSAAFILYYHRWFLPSPVCDSVSCDAITLIRNKVFAPNGLCVIEIRESSSSGLVLISWAFKSEDTNFITEFTFKRRNFSNKEKPQIFVQDFKGNSLKMVIDPNSFPEGFTLVKRSK